MWQLFTASSPYKKRARLAAILWTLLILFLCLMPSKDIPEVQVPLIDKWVHLVFFGGFSFLWLCARPSRRAGYLFAMLLAGIAFGALVELLQWLLTSLHRSADWLDLLADTTGSILGLSLFYLLSRIASAKSTAR